MSGFPCDGIIFSAHAIQRMFRRNISHAEVTHVARTGKIIRTYPDDTPYPSMLRFGSRQGTPLHVVVAVDSETNNCYIVTVYRPDPDLWETDFITRRN